MGIGDRIRAIAESKALDLTEFAELVDVPYRTLQNYVYGKREPGAESVAQICIRSGVDGHWLLTGVGDMYPAGSDGDVPELPALAVPVLGCHERRIEALASLLGALDPESRDAILTESFARATTAQQLADLRAAVSELTAKKTA